MSNSILDQVTLGYQLVWNESRELCAVQLFVGTRGSQDIDVPHLLAGLAARWSGQAPSLLLSPLSPILLSELLDRAPADAPRIEVNQAWLHDAQTNQRVHRAHQRGLHLVWRGEPGQRPSKALAPCFERTMVSLTAEEALNALRSSRDLDRRPQAQDSRLRSPVRAGQIYESVASRALVDHCLDQQSAWGVAGWPVEDVLHGYRHQPMQADQQTIIGLIEALEADDTTETIETIEHTLVSDALLAYRFLRYTNSAALGLRTEIESVRHGLMVLGHARLKDWLLQQLPHAVSDVDLQPIRTAMAVRAKVMAQLLDAGEGDELRRELYLCGVLSQIDLVMGEPMATALQRIPVSGRIKQALLHRAGPYAPYLEIAIALESSNTQAILSLCESHDLSAGETNRVLLRTLGGAPAQATRGLLVV